VKPRAEAKRPCPWWAAGFKVALGDGGAVVGYTGTWRGLAGVAEARSAAQAAAEDGVQAAAQA
jgi:hypothetical protein